MLPVKSLLRVRKFISRKLEEVPILVSRILIQGWAFLVEFSIEAPVSS